MTLYEFNKSGYTQLPKMTQAELEQKEETLAKRVSTWNCKYMMLLCNDRRDYTTIRLLNNSKSACAIAAHTCIEIARDRGILKSIEPYDSTADIWITDEAGESFMYKLFPYDWGVVEIE